MRTSLYGQEHEQFRATVRAFIQREAVPNVARWEDQRRVDIDFYRKAGELGILGLQVPEAYGGGGQTSFTYNLVVAEEMIAAHLALSPIRVHIDVVIPYFLSYAAPRQKDRWLGSLASGDTMASIAMSEPEAGSDIGGIKTTARRDGENFVINGAKTFITGGINAGLVIVVARTSLSEDRRNGLSLFVVQDGTLGYTKTRNLNKLGMHYADTAELSFADVVVNADDMLGEEGRAFEYLTSNLAQERISVAAGSVAMAKTALRDTIEYVRQREVFGRQLSQFQNTKFVLAAVSAEIEAADSLLQRAVAELDAGELSGADAARVKLFCSEMQARAVDSCLQLFGGYGYMLEYPIAKMYADARVSRIYGGSSEIMKTIIAKSMGL
ncbi:acyl-CoA dehydrogenase family protein [Mycolicibacterium holsaticum]|uniref:acyl-CoA dehydrogenase family protein n=1 Tax=Mycolicibacterium holsaticum TaxID=152142 RepID=UPI001C7CD8BF|nr:acyl-CoA dehydrogenase family protein [Mycolicibacterium holsaticum]MDA4106940.1 acyl-CoA dehydrogenase [Mycolicibacterium holsaticum DSM 44478 = JCM 12374]QZA12378.1 acyl-CoA dehydrogenase family protein [Mycolicibacterium holsaticum DSM 44478 = JCM 12374]UNC10138.1 acyl-CoA dehydrogenase family protein [Mycolicibacterium holsaticum DSM 44478 = JCM 12374]